MRTIITAMLFDALGRKVSGASFGVGNGFYNIVAGERLSSGRYFVYVGYHRGSVHRRYSTVIPLTMK